MDPAAQPQETPTEELPVDKKPSSLWSRLGDTMLDLCEVVLAIMPGLTPVMASLTEVATRYEAQLSALSRLVEQLSNKTASHPAAVPTIQPEQARTWRGVVRALYTVHAILRTCFRARHALRGNN